MKNFQFLQNKNLEKITIISIVVISFFFWNTYLIYPIKLFIVLLHEISHGISAIISGGKIIQIEVDYSLGGLCTVEGGNEILIAFSGYIGSIVLGGFLYYGAYHKKYLKITTSILAALIIFFAANYINNLFGTLFSILYFLILLFIPRLVNEKINKIFFSSVGLISMLYVLTDIKEDLFTLEFRQTDAQVLSEIIGFHPIIWGLLWLGIATLIIVYLIKHTIIKQK